MFIRSIEIDGVSEPVTLARTDNGCLVTAGNRVVCEMRRDDTQATRWERAIAAATAILGVDRFGRVAATNSMIDEVLREMERLC